jgi:hypothetical protein
LAEVVLGDTRDRIGDQGVYCFPRGLKCAGACRSSAWNHDLVALYDYAVLYGLARDPFVTEELPHLSELHQVHYARYPQPDVKPVALIAHFDDLIDQLIADISQATALR